MLEIKRFSPLRQHWIGVVPARIRSDSVSLEEVPFQGRVLLQADGRDRPLLDRLGQAVGFPFPRMPNTSVRKDALCLWHSPSSWMFVTGEGEQEKLIGLLKAEAKDAPVAITDISDSHTTIRLGGTRIREVLAKGCLIDLRAKSFEPRMVVRTQIAEVPVILFHEESGAYFDIHVGGFDADYLWTWLIEAAREFTLE